MLMQNSSSPDEIKHLPDEALGWNLVIEKKWDVCIRLAKNKSFTQEILLSEHPESKTKGMKGIIIPWYLVSFKDLETRKKCEELISLFDQQNLINAQMLAAAPTDEKHPEYGANMLAMWSTGYACPTLLSSWIKKKLLTKEILGSSFQNKEHLLYGLNAISLMMSCLRLHQDFHQAEILKILKIIDLPMLLVKPKISNALFDLEDTALAALAYFGYNWDYFAVLLKDKNFYPEILLNEWKRSNNFRACTIIVLMVLDKQWNLINELLESDHITQPLLASHVIGEIGAQRRSSINVLWLLAKAQQWELINKLLDKDLISSALLKSHSPYNESIHKETIKVDPRDVNVLWLLAHKNQRYLFRKLLKKGLIDSEMLGCCPNLMQTHFCGANVLWLLAYFEQWEIIQDLLNQGLITSSLLASRLEGVEPENFQGMSVLDLAARKGEWDLLKEFDKRKLITTSILRSCSENESDQYYGCHLVTRLFLQDKQELVKRLIPKINTELLLQIGNRENFLALLLARKDFTLILELLNSPLNPLRLVPWDRFNTDPLILHYQSDEKTIKRLAGIGISPVAIEPPKKIAEIFQKIDKITPCTFHQNGTVFNLTNFNFKSLRNYFDLYAEGITQLQIVFAHSLSKEFALSHKGATSDMLKLILEYVMGNWEEYGWPDDKSAAYLKEIKARYLKEIKEQTVSGGLLNSAEINCLTGTYFPPYKRNAADLWNFVLTQNWIPCINLTNQNHLNSSIILYEHPESESNGMEGINIFWYLISIYRQAKNPLNIFLEVLIEKNLITEAALISAPTNPQHPHYGEDVLQCLISNGSTFCFFTLLMKDIITFDVFNRTRKNFHVLQELIIRNQWDNIDLLIYKKIITKEMLMFPYTAEINLFGMLAGYQRWETIKNLRYLITSELLLTGVATTTKCIEDINVIAWFARREQWELIKLFIDEINTQMLISQGEYSSALSVLLEQKQFGLIRELRTASLAPLQTVPWQYYKQSNFKAFVGHSMKGGQTTYHLENFNYRSQAEYWRLRNLETIKRQIFCMCLFFAEWKLHAELNLDPKLKQSLEESLSKLSYLILFYALEDQQGFRQGVFLSNDSTKVSKDMVAPQYKEEISFFLKKGMSVFATQPNIRQKIDLLTRTEILPISR